MAFTTPTTTNAQTMYTGMVNALKYKWNESVPVLLNTTLKLWPYFQPKEVTHDGEYRFQIAMQTTLNEAGAPAAELDALPDSQKPTFDLGYLYLKKLIQTMLVSNETIDQAKGPNALVNGLNNNMEATVKAFMLMVEESMHVDSGIVGTAAANYSGQTVTMDSARFFRVGMTVDAYATDKSTKHATAIVVSAVDYLTNIVTFTGTVTAIIATDMFFRVSSFQTSPTIATIKAPQGIEAIISASDPIYGNFQTLARASKAYACAISRDASHAAGSAGTAIPITLMRIAGALQGVIKGSYAELPDFMYGTLETYNSVVQLYRNNNMPTVTMPATDGRPGGLAFHYDGKDIPIVDSKYAYPGRLYGITRDSMFRYHNGEMRWDDKAGFLKWISGYHAFGAIYYAYLNWGCTRPDANFVLKDITETTY
jgi:hypothetical protein